MSTFFRFVNITWLVVCCIFSANAQAPSALEQHILNLQATVQNRRAIISDLRADQAHMMPIGILGDGDGKGKPMVILDELVLYPNYAEFKAYAAVTLPGAGSSIFFATPEPVKMTYNGGILGTARLVLANDKKISANNGTSDFTVLKDRSYLEFDCKGFKRCGLAVSVNMPKFIVPEDGNGEQLLDQRVKGSFSVEFSDLNDIIASINIDPFQVRGMKGVSFTVQDAIIDLSDLNNAPNMAFPKDYQQDYFDGVDMELWTGFYLKSLWMFKRAGMKNSNNRIYQFWQQDNHPIELSTNKMIEQRLDYLHENPVIASVVTEAQYYKYSSALDYYEERKGLVSIEILQ